MDKNIVSQAIKDLGGAVTLKKMSHDDLYGELESAIDALLYEPEYSAHNYEDENGDPSHDAELILERLVFKAIKKVKKQRHKCDPYYDDAFKGYDCVSEMEQ